MEETPKQEVTMKFNHFILDKVYMYPRRAPLTDPSDCTYDSLYGAWLWNSKNGFVVLVKSSNPERPHPKTKKFDIETGEDLKGE